MMSVSDLIKQLEELDPDLPVKLSVPGTDVGLLADVRHVEGTGAVSGNAWVLLSIGQAR